jgi:hypothetical protein
VSTQRECALHGRWAFVKEETAVMFDVEHAECRWQALLRYYQGGDDLRALRKDYDAERARVDKLIELVAR